MNITKQIYAAFLAATAFWCLLILAAPLLHAAGGPVAESLSRYLYGGFSNICHQIDARSLHVLGSKLGVCVRCTSIYFSFLAGVLLIPIVRRLDSGALPGPAWMIVAILPMALDAVLNDLGILASTEWSRVITGSLAGLVFAFFIVPVFVEAITQVLVHRTLQGDSRYAGKTQ